MQIPSFTPKNLSSKNKSDLNKEENNQKYDDSKLQTVFVPTSVIINPILKTDKNSDNFKVKKKKQKIFSERNGDWTCKKCNNLNFAFRKECNMCKFPKNEDDVKKKEEKVENPKKNENYKKNKNYFESSNYNDRQNYHKKNKYKYKNYGVYK